MRYLPKMHSNEYNRDRDVDVALNIRPQELILCPIRIVTLLYRLPHNLLKRRQDIAILCSSLLSLADLQISRRMGAIGEKEIITEDEAKGSVSEPRHVCVVNLGLWRTGSTTLATTASIILMTVYRIFPELQSETLKGMLLTPEETVTAIVTSDGIDKLVKLFEDYDFVGDGLLPLLILLPDEKIQQILAEASKRKIELVFVATTRDMESNVQSELHHWVRHDLVRRAGLTKEESDDLEEALCRRWTAHTNALNRLPSFLNVTKLPLGDFETSWAASLSKTPVRFSQEFWQRALQKVGRVNSSPRLPIEAILLTLRVGSGIQQARAVQTRVKQLLDSVETDHLCRYMLVLAIDDDEYESKEKYELEQYLLGRRRLNGLVHVLCNPPRKRSEPFRICHVWHEMATKAWKEGASWVMLLGDDVRIQSPTHYRAIYRAFLDIERELGCPFGFGCPWFNDVTFAGFPTFPVVGREHLNIFKGLIPSHRMDCFVNQDLDPYLQRLYLKFGAAPYLVTTNLENSEGGTNSNGARYKRIEAKGWRDFVRQDDKPITDYLHLHQKKSSPKIIPKILLDVVIPTYRLELEYLRRICELKVPETLRTTFIVVVDNPDWLIQKALTELEAPDSVTGDQAASLLQEFLSAHSPTNNIRVRCNATNLGASASRNRGIEESAADYILFLDDDVTPNAGLLDAYQQAISTKDEETIAFVGMVRFPRSPTLPLRHAAVLMSYLTFMFEIAADPIYESPAWGVTANLVVEMGTGVRFDTAYAKTGGGEDVDFCLRLTRSRHGGHLRSVPEAVVVHDFWKGGAIALSRHFSNWAVGDSALFDRFPDQVYRSFPNFVETAFFTFSGAILVSIYSQRLPVGRLVVAVPLLLAADFLIDASDQREFRNRGRLLQYRRSLPFRTAAHVLANYYVVVLEAGRFYGHAKRGHVWRNAMKRFDWHCGRLPGSRRQFVVKEGYKFAAFVAIITSLFLQPQLPQET
jgi:glycosyltransferase involved in cell wall biosynthesis